jgi:hypothetical protein
MMRFNRAQALRIGVGASIVGGFPVLLAVGGSAGVGGAAEPTWQHPRAISAPCQNARSPELAIDSEGNALAAWSQSRRPRRSRIEVAFRPAEGRFKAARVVSARGLRANDPRLAFDGEGNALAVWQRTDGPVRHSRSRIVATFRPVGGSFGTVRRLSALGQSSHEPQVAMDDDGDALAVWRPFDGRRDRVAVAFRPNGGSFAAGQMISAPREPTDSPQIALDGEGNAIATWIRFNGRRDPIRAAFRPAGGSFGQAETIPGSLHVAPYPWSSELAFDDEGNALAVWASGNSPKARIEAAFRPAGGTFGPAETISAQGQRVGSPDLAFDEDGNALVVWSRAGRIARLRVEAAFRPASGSFGKPQTISGRRSADSPQVTFDPDGNALAVWAGGRSSKRRIKAAFRPAGGDFGPGRAVSGRGHDAASPQVAFEPDGNALAVWQRFDGSNWRIQAASTELRPSARVGRRSASRCDRDRSG